MARLGLLIPEFPTQTHIAMWRLGEAMRRAGVTVEMISTRRPEGEGPVHPALAEEAERAFYCWPAPMGAVLREAGRSIARLPRAFGYVLGLRESGLAERLRVLGMIVPALALRRRARRRRLGHLLVHSCASAAHVAALCRVLGGPRYSLRLGGDIDVYGKDQASKMRRASHVVGAARVNKAQVHERTGLPDARVVWTWLGVETGRFRPGTHVRSASAPVRIATVARLNRAKGHRFVLDAVALARTRGSVLHYTIVGDGPERAAIEEQIRALELDGQVELTGSLDEEGVRAVLEMSEVFVLPTSGPGEGSPVAVLEAMSAGLAVVASDVGGLGDMVGPDEGVLVPPGDSAALADALLELASDPARRAAMGAAARERAVREFDVGAVAERLIRLMFPRFAAARTMDGADGGRSAAGPDRVVRGDRRGGLRSAALPESRRESHEAA